MAHVFNLSGRGQAQNADLRHERRDNLPEGAIKRLLVLQKRRYEARPMQACHRVQGAEIHGAQEKRKRRRRHPARRIGTEGKPVHDWAELGQIADRADIVPEEVQFRLVVAEAAYCGDAGEHLRWIVGLRRDAGRGKGQITGGPIGEGDANLSRSCSRIP